jgi:hypothetical protein
MNVINGYPLRSVSTNIFHCTLPVFLFLSRKFKACRLAEIFYILGFESKFYLETCCIVFVIFLLLSQNDEVIIITFLSRCVREKSTKNKLPPTKLLKVTMF